MKIVVIGKDGQLGKALQQTCDKNVIFYSFSRDELDITKKRQVNAVFFQLKPDVVINTAAYHVVAMCEKNPQEAYRINSIAVKDLATICKKLQCSFVTYSTDYVFDGKKGKAYLEEDKPNPLQTYGQSKLTGEYAALNEYPEKTYIIRTNGIYGGISGSRSKGGNFVLNLLRDLSKKDQIEVADDYFANPTSANALAKATFDLLTHDSPAGIYHLASEGFCSWYDFAKKIVKYAKLNKTIIPVQEVTDINVLKRPKFSVLANSKAKKLGIVLPTVEKSLEQYLKEILPS